MKQEKTADTLFIAGCQRSFAFSNFLNLILILVE